MLLVSIQKYLTEKIYILLYLIALAPSSLPELRFSREDKDGEEGEIGLILQFGGFTLPHVESNIYKGDHLLCLE